jgi:hypothetical protein
VPQGANAPTGSVTFNAYGPNDPTCSSPPAFTTTVSLSGAGTSAFSGNFTALIPGTYRWTASYGGDSNYSSQTTTCNDPNETVVVNQAMPSLSSAASSSVTVGGSLSDTATLSGGDNPGGTIMFKLFGPNDATCVGSPIFTSKVNTVNGNGTYASDPFTAFVSGTYNWVVTYSGDTNNQGASEACGAGSESVVVTAAATQVKLASSVNPSTPGQPVTFTATVEGRMPTGTVTFKDGSIPLGTATVDPSGTTVLTTSSLGAGSHSVTAVYSGDTNNRGSTSDAITQLVSSPSSNAPPSISIASPISRARYHYGQFVRARYACRPVDDGPAVRSCAGTVPNGSRIDTRRPGIHTFSVTAVDNAGDSAVKTVVYRVVPSNHAGVSRIGAHADGSVRFRLRLPGPGAVDVLETAWIDNYARSVKRHRQASRVLLQPAPERFVFARAHLTARKAGAITVIVKPNSAGRKLLARYRYQPVIRLWVSFTPTGGAQRDHGFYGLLLPDGSRSADRCAVAEGVSAERRYQHIQCDVGRRQTR